MNYVPQWLTQELWEGAESLNLGGAADVAMAEGSVAVREAVAVARTYGLPCQVEGMFYPAETEEPFQRVETFGSDAYVYILGCNETNSPAFYALDADGRVVLVDPALPAPRMVNSSLLAFLDALAAWNHRLERLDDFEEREDGEEERVAFGMSIAERLRQLDPPAFADDDTWWSRVYEEVELDVI